MAKRVTYLIGAGASANALPVVNGMNDRMDIFLKILSSLKHPNNSSYSYDNNKIVYLKELLREIKNHYTIDTLAKKYFLKEETQKLNFLKNLLSGYFYFEQLLSKNDSQLKDSIERWASENEISQKYRKEDINGYQKSDEYKKLYKHIFNSIDYRYDSFFANFLEKENNKLVIPSYVNIISWNYDSQFELAYSNYLNKNEHELSSIQELLQVYPNQEKFEINNNLSSIIKLNGSATFINDEVESKVDLVASNFNHVIAELRKINNKRDENLTNVNFAWEKDEQVTKAREDAQSILLASDIVVIIGYSFPTFNREVDREIFKNFNNHCIERRGDYKRYDWGADEKFRIRKKIYIQDTPENAPKIRERLKAIGNNLFDVAEVYDDVDQFLIPYEL